jgi:hypothetical protein
MTTMCRKGGRPGRDRSVALTMEPETYANLPAYALIWFSSGRLTVSRACDDFCPLAAGWTVPFQRSSSWWQQSWPGMGLL